MSAATINQMFRACADPTRIRILHLLRQNELCVGDLVDILALPQPKVSRHLRYLRYAELVICRKQGRWCFYSLAAAKTTFQSNLIGCLGSCFGKVPELKVDATRAMKLREIGGCCPLHRNGDRS